jgi:hypothetical protein
MGLLRTAVASDRAAIVIAPAQSGALAGPVKMAPAAARPEPVAAHIDIGATLVTVRAT